MAPHAAERLNVMAEQYNLHGLADRVVERILNGMPAELSLFFALMTMKHCDCTQEQIKRFCRMVAQKARKASIELSDEEDSTCG
jgi:redox-regulated HSP33 family molecular chaperone